MDFLISYSQGSCDRDRFFMYYDRSLIDWVWYTAYSCDINYFWFGSACCARIWQFRSIVGIVGINKPPLFGSQVPCQSSCDSAITGMGFSDRFAFWSLFQIVMVGRVLGIRSFFQSSMLDGEFLAIVIVVGYRRFIRISGFDFSKEKGLDVGPLVGSTTFYLLINDYSNLCLVFIQIFFFKDFWFNQWWNLLPWL